MYTNLKDTIVKLIEMNKEGDYWDFKQKWHNDVETLIYDILCFTNTLHDKNSFLIFGVSDNFEVLGVENDENRKTQAMVLDTLDNCEFAGGNKPKVSVETIIIDGKEIDILTIYNTRNTPVYLEKTNKKHNKLTAGFIYSRFGDKNSSINKNSNYNFIESLWKKRFGLLRSPIEEFKRLLLDKKNWQYVELENDTEYSSYYYHKYKPNFLIKFSHLIKSDKKEAYSYLMPKTTTYFKRVDFVYNQVILEKISCVILDSGKYQSSIPEKKFFFRCMNSNPLVYRYYIKNSLIYNFHRFSVREDSAENLILNSYFCSIVSLFNSELEGQMFDQYLNENKERFYNLLNNFLSEDFYIEEDNKKTYDIMKKEISVSKAVKQMLNEFRSK
ncbi:ATP-binding protein (plasmid) [Clostridium perfringens]